MSSRGRLVVGFSGPMRCGKTTAANQLVAKWDFDRIRFAGPLKAMMRCLRLTEAQIDGIEKEVPIARLGGITPRQMMQTIGTEWGRNLVCPDIWVSTWKEFALDSLNRGLHVVCDDVRFQNEVDAIHFLGGHVIAIQRPGVVAAGHISELQQLQQSDFTLVNDGSHEKMFKWLDDYVQNAIYDLGLSFA